MVAEETNNMRNKRILGHYEQNEFNEWAFNVVEKGFSPLESEYISLFDNKNARILDIGCGGGRLSLGLLNLGFIKIAGIDFSFKFCSVYNDRFATMQKKVFAINGTAASLPFPSGAFGYVLCLGNLLSFLSEKAERKSALEEIERVLAPGGVVIISVLHFPARSTNYLLYPFLKIARFFQRDPPPGHNLPWLKKAGRINLCFPGQNEPQAYWFTKKEFVDEINDTSLRPIMFGDRVAEGVPLLCALQKQA
jgi:SAM-dependent methyltransferase